MCRARAAINVFKRYDKFASLAKSIEKNEGGLEQFSRGYESFGINQQDDGGVYCKEWAPGANSVCLVGDFSKYSLSMQTYCYLITTV
ncbi:hypothetical protein scyTo_0007971 [Scyliorhinus torazame]|uniref:Glycoside hydrolase family 13 N-terminal domain-containing protein n=1 Tax=Scyliorhinus torazame TaxID=75743 RepID=A0A401P1F8_SCYTO|nr:hypothetical protein [Scyliorhinus torazame]